MRNLLRWSLLFVSLCLTVHCLCGLYIAVQRAEALKDYRRAKFQPPAGCKVYVDGEQVTPVVYLSPHRSYAVSYRKDGNVVQEFSYTAVK